MSIRIFIQLLGRGVVKTEELAGAACNAEPARGVVTLASHYG